MNKQTDAQCKATRRWRKKMKTEHDYGYYSIFTSPEIRQKLKNFYRGLIVIKDNPPQQ